jgi:hypothetical protein
VALNVAEAENRPGPGAHTVDERAHRGDAAYVEPVPPVAD